MLASNTNIQRELTITRTFDAPRDVVFDAWTNPAVMQRWMGPRGFQAIHVEQGTRAGDAWRICLRPDDGGPDLWCGGVCREITPPERLVFTSAWDDENGNPRQETLVTIEFHDRSGKTEMAFHQIGFESDESRDGHVEGWTSTFDRLAEEVTPAQQSAGSAVDADAVIRQSVEAIERAKADLLRTFEFVPEDRLKWSPAPTARTPLWIVAHCGSANGAAAAMLRGETLQLHGTPEEISAQIRAGGKDATSRGEAVESVERSVAEIIGILTTEAPQRLGTMVDTPFGPMPYEFWVSFPAAHMMGHARQVDYLETIWNDLQEHL